MHFSSTATRAKSFSICLSAITLLAIFKHRMAWFFCTSIMPRNNSISDSVNFSLLIFHPHKIQITSPSSRQAADVGRYGRGRFGSIHFICLPLSPHGFRHTAMYYFPILSVNQKPVNFKLLHPIHNSKQNFNVFG